MSKASEWAARMTNAALDRPACRVAEEEYALAVVKDDGWLHINEHACDIPPDTALKLAAWILATFGEPE